MTLNEALTRFLAWCTRHRSAGTTRKYRGTLRVLANTLGDRDVSELRPLHIHDWLDAVTCDEHGNEQAPNTQRGYVAGFLRWQSWSVANGILTAPIVAKLEKPAPTLRETLPSEADLDAVRRYSHPAFRLILDALCRSGARPHELAEADIDQYHRDDREIVIVQHKTARKTGRPRIIHVGDKLAEILDRAIGPRTAGRIFLTPRRQVWTSATLSNTWARVRSRSGISASIRLYDATRHRFATAVVSKYGIARAADLLGHSDIATTKRYDHANSTELRQITDDI